MPCWVYEVRSVSRDEAEKRESAEVETYGHGLIL